MRRALFILLPVMIVLGAHAAEDLDTPAGKRPDWETPGASEGSPPVDSDIEPLVPYVSSPEQLQKRLPPKPFVTLQNVVEFIQLQRGLHGRGLPATFYVPSSIRISNPLRELIVSEGAGLYDTALAVIALVEAGDLRTARQILDIYAEGSYSTESSIPLDLRAMPNRNNGGAFSNFDDQAYYFFDFTNVYGDWARWRDRWAFWGAHSGPNAWFINAVIRFIDASHRAGQSDSSLESYRTMAEAVAAALLRLQDSEALGGIRYGPKDQYAEEGTAEPFDQINSENNLSAYVAFQMLYGLTGKVLYRDAAQHILEWFQNASVWTDQGQPRRGLFDAETSTLAMGAEYHHGRWVLQKEHPTDSGGTWAISSLGPEKIDELWGPETAYKMWQTLRARAGRTSDFKRVKNGEALAGLDYTDAFPESESLISPEWTAGGLFALRLLIPYYEHGAGQRVLKTPLIEGMKEDARTLTVFIRAHPNSYAMGPGFGGKRLGQTGFGWFAPPPEVQAMSSIYVSLYLENKSDPSAWWRTIPPSK